MRVYVEYKVPVLVEVDLDEQTVVAVHVVDEQVEGPGSVMGLDETVLSAHDAARATAVSEDGPWPAWEFGL